MRATTISLLMTAAVWAADNVTPLDVRLGLWETKSTSQMNGTPPIPESMLRSLSPEQRTKMEAMAKAREAKGPQSHTQQTCVTKEMLAKAMAFGGKDGCTSTVIRSSRRAQDVRFTCTDSNSNMKGTGEFHIDAADSEHVTGTSTVKMEGGGNTMDVKASFTSHWVSADCGAQKH
jgi:Protein of unknown function (DUF3617)